MNSTTAQLVGTEAYSLSPGREVVTAQDIGVLNPVPNRQPSTTPWLPILTLTTCWPRLSSDYRLIIHAVLTERYAKEDGFVPSELEERPGQVALKYKNKEV